VIALGSGDLPFAAAGSAKVVTAPAGVMRTTAAGAAVVTQKFPSGPSVIAVGIGITPLHPMISEVAAAGHCWQLVYGGRRRASLAFLGELGRHGSRVTIHPEDELGLLPLERLLADPRPGIVVYCCGPERLLVAAETRCSSWPDGSFHCERFAPKPDEAEGRVDREIVVALKRSRLELTVRPGESILEVLKQAGVDMASPEPVRQAFQLFESRLTQMEQLLR